MKRGQELTEPTARRRVVIGTYDSLDEALMETFPASDPIAVDALRPVEAESGGPSGVDPVGMEDVDEWRDLLLRSRASVSLAPRRRGADPLELAS